MNMKEITKAHGLYLCGLSLAQVAVRFNVTRQRLWHFFKVTNLPTRPLVRKEFVEFNGQKYFRSNSKGYWRKSTGNRETLHRDTWEFYNGKIPEGFDVHHLDENKDNNSIENLECLSKADHTRFYCVFNNQYTKGKTYREENEFKDCPVCLVPFKKKIPSATKKAKFCSQKCKGIYSRGKPRIGKFLMETK